MAVQAASPAFTRMDDASAEQLAVVISEAQIHLTGKLVDTMVSLFTRPAHGFKAP